MKVQFGNKPSAVPTAPAPPAAAPKAVAQPSALKPAVVATAPAAPVAPKAPASAPVAPKAAPAPAIAPVAVVDKEYAEFLAYKKAQAAAAAPAPADPNIIDVEVVNEAPTTSPTSQEAAAMMEAEQGAPEEPVVPQNPLVAQTQSRAPAGAVVTAEGNPQALAVVPQQQNAVATSGNRAAFADDDNIMGDELILPRLNLVQKVGELSNVFTPGSIVLNGQFVLVDAPKPNTESSPLDILIIGFRPMQFAERVAGGGRGNIFNTEAEVAQVGGTTDYNVAKATSCPLYQRMVTALCLIAQPAGLDDTMFPCQFVDEATGTATNYAMCLWTMKGTAYTNGARTIKTARKIGHLRKEGYRSGWWKLTTKLKSFSGDEGATNYVFIPNLRAYPTPSLPALRAWITEMVGF